MIQYFVAAVSLFMLVGCATQSKPEIITDIVTHVVTVDDHRFDLPKAPPPLTKEDLQGSSKDDKIIKLIEKNIELYGHIELLEYQILGISQEVQDKAKRIWEGNLK